MLASFGPRALLATWPREASSPVIRTSCVLLAYCNGDIIAVVDELPQVDAEMGEAVVKQAFDFWIGPEIERRREAGQLPEDFALHGAQVIFGMEEGPPEVRLNDEVRAVATVVAARAIAKGEPVTDADIAEYKRSS